MFTQIQAMLQRSADALLSGQTDQIAARCHYPMVVHSRERVLPFRSATDYATTLRLMVANLRGNCQLTDIVARLRAMDVPQGGRFRAWATMTYVVTQGPTLPPTCLTYYCRVVEGQIKVEMVEMDCKQLPDHPIRGRVA